MFNVKFGDKIAKRTQDGEIETALFIARGFSAAELSVVVINVGIDGETIGFPFTDLAANWVRWPTDWGVRYDLEGGIEKIRQGRKIIAEAVTELKPIWEEDGVR